MGDTQDYSHDPNHLEYRGYHITYQREPTPLKLDWTWWSDDYDGPDDIRCGVSATPEAAKMAIDDQLEEHPEFRPQQRNWDGPMESKMKRLPTTHAMEILAISDQPVFESLMGHMGLPITGRINQDPLGSQIQNETVAAVASEITEDVNSFVEADRRLHKYKELAEDYGYIVSFR